MATQTIKLAILLGNARRDLARHDSDQWSSLVWDHACKLYERHGAALIEALIAEGSNEAHRLADSLLAS